MRTAPRFTPAFMLRSVPLGPPLRAAARGIATSLVHVRADGSFPTVTSSQGDTLAYTGATAPEVVKGIGCCPSCPRTGVTMPLKRPNEFRLDELLLVLTD